MSFYDGVTWEEMLENMASRIVNNQVDIPGVEIIKEGKLPGEKNICSGV